jgi:hypothetical protein
MCGQPAPRTKCRGPPKKRNFSTLRAVRASGDIKYLVSRSGPQVPRVWGLQSVIGEVSRPQKTCSFRTIQQASEGQEL